MVVLAWLRRSSDELKVFEANRVAAIQEVMEPGQWRHVPTNYWRTPCGGMVQTGWFCHQLNGLIGFSNVSNMTMSSRG